MRSMRSLRHDAKNVSRGVVRRPAVAKRMVRWKYVLARYPSRYRSQKALRKKGYSGVKVQGPWRNLNEDIILPALYLPHDLCFVCRTSRVVVLSSFSADQARALLSKSFLQCRGWLWLCARWWESLPSSLPFMAFAFGNRNSSLGVSGLALDDVTFQFPEPSYLLMSVGCKGSRNETASQISVCETRSTGKYQWPFHVVFES